MNKTELAKTKKLAEQGDAEAQFRLGSFFYERRSGKTDGADAVKWFRQAAEQGHVLAQRKLGICYMHGEGVKKDVRKAIEWMNKADPPEPTTYAPALPADEILKYTGGKTGKTVRTILAAPEFKEHVFHLEEGCVTPAETGNHFKKVYYELKPLLDAWTEHEANPGSKPGSTLKAYLKNLKDNAENLKALSGWIADKLDSGERYPHVQMSKLLQIYYLIQPGGEGLEALRWELRWVVHYCNDFMDSMSSKAHLPPERSKCKLKDPVREYLKSVFPSPVPASAAQGETGGGREKPAKSAPLETSNTTSVIEKEQNVNAIMEPIAKLMTDYPYSSPAYIEFGLFRSPGTTGACKLDRITLFPCEIVFAMCCHGQNISDTLAVGKETISVLAHEFRHAQQHLLWDTDIPQSEEYYDDGKFNMFKYWTDPGEKDAREFSKKVLASNSFDERYIRMLGRLTLRYCRRNFSRWEEKSSLCVYRDREAVLGSWMKLFVIGDILNNTALGIVRPELHVNFARFPILQFFFECPNARPAMKDLMAVTGLTSGALTQAIDGLIAAGYLTREHATHDRRFRYVCATEKLQALRSKAAGHFRKMLDAFRQVADVTPEEMRIMDSILGRLAKSRAGGEHIAMKKASDLETPGLIFCAARKPGSMPAWMQILHFTTNLRLPTLMFYYGQCGRTTLGKLLVMNYMFFLSGKNMAPTVSEIAARFYCTTPIASQTVDSLIRDGLVKRGKTRADQYPRVRLTKKGLLMRQQTSDSYTRFMNNFFAGQERGKIMLFNGILDLFIAFLLKEGRAFLCPGENLSMFE